MALDRQDKFTNSLEDSNIYPKNLLNTHNPIANLSRYAKMLNDPTHRLFAAQDAPIEFIEMLPGDTFFEAARIGDIKTHLALDRPDPKCRFVFLYANHDQSQLGCSKEQLQHLLTYHQVMPAFLDFIFPFGGTPYCNLNRLSGIRQLDTVLDQHDLREAIPRLGRSGSCISHTFLLHSPSATNKPVDEWSIRQAAIHYQFDVQTGQTLWIVTQGDDNLLARLRRMAIQAESPLANYFADPTTSFRPSLSVHELFFEWSVESWRDYIAQLEGDLEQVRNNIIDASMKPSKPNPDLSEDNPDANQTRYGSLTGRYNRPPLDHYQYTILLNGLEMKIIDTLCILEQTHIVHDALAIHFRKIMEYEEFPSRMKDMAYYEILRFSERVTNAHAELTLQQCRAESLLRRVQSTVSLLSAILEHGTTLPHNNYNRMHEFSDQEKKDSVSMRVITMVTLIYLPVTMLAMWLSKPLSLATSDQIWNLAFIVFAFLMAAMGILYFGTQVRRNRSIGERCCRSAGFKEKQGHGV
ncbi:hypothetical protein BKA66DRAFT_141561 [Pyrenochaeta sp. MPI-SDFR-AT-0127]|nr:hypothetical protein BKA66DRAFT_141561 [Pyrenochaeta sp. MPI-SDFR-AT-0127]